MQKYVPLDKLAEVRRVLYGHNAGGLVSQLQLPEVLYAAAAAACIDLQVMSKLPSHVLSKHILAVRYRTASSQSFSTREYQKLEPTHAGTPRRHMHLLRSESSCGLQG
jgi:hypothetical protein